jgi:hypothetical protein
MFTSLFEKEEGKFPRGGKLEAFTVRITVKKKKLD